MHASIVSELGVEFDKQAIIDVVKQVATNLKEMGTWTSSDLGFSSNEFFEVCEGFRNSAVKEAIAAIGDLLTETTG